MTRISLQFACRKSMVSYVDRKHELRGDSACDIHTLRYPFFLFFSESIFGISTRWSPQGCSRDDVENYVDCTSLLACPVCPQTRRSCMKYREFRNCSLPYEKQSDLSLRHTSSVASSPEFMRYWMPAGIHDPAGFISPADTRARCPWTEASPRRSRMWPSFAVERGLSDSYYLRDHFSSIQWN